LHSDSPDGGAAATGEEMRRPLGCVQFGPVGLSVKVVLDYGLNRNGLVLGQRVDEQLLPSTESPRHRPPPNTKPGTAGTAPNHARLRMADGVEHEVYGARIRNRRQKPAA
jgi:hypothetical protein